MATKPRPRPAHVRGVTRCAYTPDGTSLVSVGANNTIRLYKTGFDGEPTNIDDCQEQNVAVATTSEFFVTGSEDGTVSVYNLETNEFDKFLLRTSLPVRDVALSPDGKWCAVASDETTVRLVSTQDNTKVRHLREHNRPTKHLSFDPKGNSIALACNNGVIYVYSLTAEEPEMIRKVDGIIANLETDSDVSAQIAWHPDGRAFAVPTPTRSVQVISKNDWENQRSFANGHEGEITAIAWSPNGSMLATAGKDKKILIWETKSQSVIARHDYSGVIDIAWHPTNNLLSFTNAEGEVYICPDFISSQFSTFLKLPTQPAPFIHDPLAEISANSRRPQTNGHKDLPQRPRAGSPESVNFLDGEDFGDEDDFVVDDDGAGYALTRKRPHDDHDAFDERPSKRQDIFRPRYHDAFQPGSTPWRGNRKYLCINLIGFVWTVDQDSHHTVTVEFYDHELHRDYHFTDTFLYDKACLNENGALFACPPRDDTKAPATIFYRPHETWTNRSDWRTQLPPGETVLAMSLSDSFITVTTTAGYVRIYTLFGLPYRVYRPKNTPMVSCASWHDYVLTMGNGAVGPDGRTKLVYSIQNIKRDEFCQNEDTVALPEDATVKSVFFSDNGDPCIYDSTGTLLTLLHWRQPSRASWIPLLDTRLLARLASGRKHESYYPIAVADNKFHCIILKGGDQYPYFPRPLLSEFDFSIPLTSQPPKAKKAANGDGDADMADNSDAEEEADPEAETRALEQRFLLGDIRAAQLADLVDATSASASQRATLAQLELDVDKALLQLLAVECRGGEERGMRALEMAKLMRDRSGRMLEAAGKVAARYGRDVLGEKIRELAERRAAGREDGDEDDDPFS